MINFKKFKYHDPLLLTKAFVICVRLLLKYCLHVYISSIALIKLVHQELLLIKSVATKGSSVARSLKLSIVDLS